MKKSNIYSPLKSSILKYFLISIQVLFFSHFLKADIIDIQASADGGFLANGTTNVVFSVSFSSNTAENADFIEFVLPSGASTSYSLDYTSVDPTPFIGCGMNQGDHMSVNGIGWGTPAFSGGGSACGAFTYDITHQFGIEVDHTSGTAAPLNITVRIVGDGFGEAQASIASTIVQLPVVTCDVDCPANIEVNANQGDCSAFVNIPLPVQNGNCGGNPIDQSGFFQIGTHMVELTSGDGSSSCFVQVTVNDQSIPNITNCQNKVIQLEEGECSRVVENDLIGNDDCVNPPISITQSNDINTIQNSVGCASGETKYYRVFDTDDYNVNTYLNIEEIVLGVREAFNSPIITITLYDYQGTLDPFSMTVLAQENVIVPDMNDDFINVPISAIVEAGDQFAVEVTVPGALFSGFVMGTNFGGETADSYLSSVVCGVPQPQTFSTLGYPNESLVMAVNGYKSSTRIYQTSGNYQFGEEFPIGNHNLGFEVIDAAGNTSQCSFTVSVVGVNPSTGAIACNDLVQISLDTECEETVTADQILEGGFYGCFDNYIVDIEDAQGNSIGDVVTADHIGQTLKVTVTNANGNSCWGEILIEDKFPPALECLEVYTSCTGDLTPGSDLGHMLTFPSNIVDGSLNASAPNSKTFYVDVFGLNKSTLTDLNVEIGVTHTNPNELVASITSPTGHTINLFNSIAASCPGNNMMITLDDEAFYTYADLQSFCDTTDPAVHGIFRSADPLSNYDGIDPNGTWAITIADLAAGNGGDVSSVKLIIQENGGTVTLPTSKDVTYTVDDDVYTVQGLDECGEATLSYTDEVLEEDCNSIYLQVIARTWFAHDAQGNISESCIQTIYVYRNGLATLTWPADRDDVQADALNCLLWGETVPGPDVTGYPTGDLCSNVQIFDPEDTRIDICPKSYKIIRKWRVLEWCTSEVREHNQIIKVIDEEGPQMVCPDDITLSANADECETTVTIDRPEITSECSDNLTYRLYYLQATHDGTPDPDGFYIDDNVVNGQTITGVPFGNTWVKWEVTDECNNTNSCFFTITVIDDAPPVAVCDEFTKVAVGSDGLGVIKANTFDDGSHDNCGEITWEVRKMTDKCGISGTSYRDEVFFCCAEIGDVVMVQFKIEDEFNNENSCMVEVSVEDKLPPYITDCPEDITIDCHEDYTDTSITGMAIGIDNCQVTDLSFEDSGDVDNCGRGTIRRTWTIVDHAGFKNSCTQYITLEDMDPFDSDDINWPNDYKAFTCGTNLNPENLPDSSAYPIIDDDICALTAATYKDQLFSFVDESCLKILRTWTVIDWCTYDENNPTLGEGYFQHLQVIKLENTVAPTIVTSCEDIKVSSFGACGDVVELTLKAEDDCTAEDDLNYSWTVDANNDGSIDFGGSTNTMKRYYDDGTHKIYWRVEDKCGNVTTCAYLFVVLDGKKPTPYCRSSVTTVVMNNNGQVDIWASDFDLGSTDNCTPQDELRLSFSTNVNQTSLTFTCNDIPDGQEMYIPVEMYVTDNAGNYDFCSVGVILQDNEGDACPDNNLGNIFTSGRIVSENNEPLSGVEVTIDANLPEFPRIMNTIGDGNYVFNDLPIGQDYTVSALNDNDILNGVSTLDIVLIQRHILNLANLDSPYKVIASDINNDEKVSASDLSKLRKLILGVDAGFDNGQSSWRFIKEHNGINDQTDPFPFLEVLEHENLQISANNQNFVGVKIGDVNDSKVINAKQSKSETRSSQKMTVEIPQMIVDKNTSVEIPFFANEISKYEGFQYTLEFDQNVMVFEEIVYTDSNFSADNFGVHNTDQGQITVSWNGNVEDNENAQFAIRFTALKSFDASEELYITSSATAAEAYDHDLNIYDITLSSVRDVKEELEGFQIYQNRPNPFNNRTTISYHIPSDDEVKIKIFDINGKLIYAHQEYAKKGQNSLEINIENIGVTGVLYYEIEYRNQRLSKRMLSID